MMQLIVTFRNFAKARKKDEIAVFKQYVMKRFGKVKAKIHLFLTLLLNGVCVEARNGESNAK
jgi:hypothetical protein